MKAPLSKITQLSDEKSSYNKKLYEEINSLERGSDVKSHMFCFPS